MTENELQHAVLVHSELKEVSDRLFAEGIGFQAVAAGIASLANEMISNAMDQSTAAAWFYAMGDNALNASMDDGNTRQ